MVVAKKKKKSYTHPPLRFWRAISKEAKNQNYWVDIRKGARGERPI
jgi:hypothetical protein